MYINETKYTRAIEIGFRWYGIYVSVFEGFDCDYLPWRMGTVSFQWALDKGFWKDRYF